MNFRLLIPCVLLSFFTSSWVHAQSWALWLEDIHILSNTDTFGDQVYFFVLEKQDSELVSYTSLPSFPFSYTNENLLHFEPGILWQGDCDPEHHLSLAITLLDREALPWIADEILGNLEVTLEPDFKGLALKWNALTPSVSFNENQSSPMTQRVHVESNGGKYYFDLKWKMVEDAHSN